MARTARETTGNMCDLHPDRPGIGKCRGCGRVVCRDCVTRMKGIMYCPSCVDIRFKAKKHSSFQDWIHVFKYVEAFLSVSLLLLFLYGLITVINDLRW